MAIDRRVFLAGLSATLSTVFPQTTWYGLFGTPPAAAQPLPSLPADIGKGRKVAVIGAGIAGLTSAYELLKASFDVTVFEGQKRYGGRSLTVRPSDPDYRSWYLAKSRFVSEDSYCDFVPAEVRGAMVPEQRCTFSPVRTGEDDYVDQYFNAGPGRISTHHTGVLHYCRELGVDLIPYIFVSETNLLQAADFNGGKPVQIRKFRYDMRGYVAELLEGAAEIKDVAHPEMSARLKAKLQKFLTEFGDLSSAGIYLNSPRAGYVVSPGAGTNAGILRKPFPLNELLNADDLWSALLASAHYDWQLPLLQPAGGMDMIWQAFLTQRIDDSELRNRVRLEHDVTGMRYADATRSRVAVSFNRRDGAGSEVFDYVIMTGQPFVLLDMDMKDVLDDDVPKRLNEVVYFRAGKYGWQARSRFWEAPDVGIFGGISWTADMIGQIWYPSDGYNQPTGVLTGAYILDNDPVDRNGTVYPAEMDYKVAVDLSDLPASKRYAARWGEMDQAARTAQALSGGEKLHPGFSQNVYRDSGLSVAWQNQPYQIGVSALHMPTTRPDAYARLIRPIDRVGRVYLAGDSISYDPSWQEGAIRSAWWTLGLIKDHAAAHGGAQ